MNTNRTTPDIQNPITRLLEDLIRFKTISADSDANLQALEYCKIYAEARGLESRLYTSNGYHSLVMSANTSDLTPRLSLAAHMDVVSGPAEAFDPVRKNGKIYGRGAFDMKFAIACYLLLLQELKGKMKEYDFNIVITTDEETGGENGVKYLVEEQGYCPRLVFLPDGGENWKIQSEAKGNLAIDIKAAGTAAHASSPWKGKNAYTLLNAFLTELLQNFVEEPCDDREHRHSTINIGSIQGWQGRNSVPGELLAEVEIRYPPSSRKQEYISLLESLSKKHPGIAFQEKFSDEALKFHLDTPEIDLYSDIAAKRLPRNSLDSMLAHGASDASYFDLQKTGVLMIRPEGGGQHEAEEWIDESSLQTFYEVLKEWFMRVAVKAKK